MNRRVILASASPRRLELLRQIDIECIVRPVDIDESALADERALEFVGRMAQEKALACREMLGDEYYELPIIGADTIVEIDDEILGKPRDRKHAADILARLSARAHHVHTAVTVLSHRCTHQCLSSSEVRFAELDATDIDRYIDTGEPMDKAGAYAIQGRAAAFIEELKGSYTGVVGLPLHETMQLLSECGIEKI